MKTDFATTMEVALAAAEAGVVAMLLGDPGVGKSALARLVADALGLPLEVVIGSTLDPTDVGGLPVKVDSPSGGWEVVRVPMRPFKRAAERPTLVLLDEVSAAPLGVQAAYLRVALERTAGDVELHEGSRVILATNPPEQAPGGFELSAPLVGRVSVAHLRPTDEEVLAHLSGLGGEGSPLRLAAASFVAAARRVDLLQVDIPPDCVAGGVPWGSPRAWERALRMLAAAHSRGASEPAVRAVLADNVGEQLAASFLGAARLEQLPSPEAAAADPTGCRLPAEMDLLIACLGLVARVAKSRPWAAWVLAARLPDDLGVACASNLLKLPPAPMTDPLAKDGVRARVALTAKVQRFSADRTGAMPSRLAGGAA